jgi:dephospho-CoA kinase
MLKFKELIDEGVNDPAIFKAVFLAGGPGSGKSFIVGRTALTAHGFRVVNSDDAFEKSMKDAGLEMNPENIFSDQGQAARKGAKVLTGKRRDLYIQGRLGLVIDGTGRDSAKIIKQKSLLEQTGYETAMVFVNTDLETAIERDKERTRSLGEDQVTKMWKSVQRNIGTFQRTFGRNFYVVDNSIGSDFNSDSMRVYKEIGKWSKKDPRNRIAQSWIRAEKSK